MILTYFYDDGNGSIDTCKWWYCLSNDGFPPLLPLCGIHYYHANSPSQSPPLFLWPTHTQKHKIPPHFMRKTWHKSIFHSLWRKMFVNYEHSPWSILTVHSFHNKCPTFYQHFPCHLVIGSSSTYSRIKQWVFLHLVPAIAYSLFGGFVIQNVK